MKVGEFFVIGGHKYRLTQIHMIDRVWGVREEIVLVRDVEPNDG